MSSGTGGLRLVAASARPRAVFASARGPAAIAPRAAVVVCSASGARSEEAGVPRRVLLLAGGLGAALGALSGGQDAQAVQGLTAGRIPGLGPVADDGFRQYMRPEGKSGGHGVGWSEIPPYGFRVPDGWEEVPTSIADLGGAEVDLRFRDLTAAADKGSNIAVVVAPVLRFVDVGFNADVRIESLVPLDKLIYAFGPELTGETIDDANVASMASVKKGDLTYYTYELKELIRSPSISHMLVSATAFKNRLYILAVAANSLGWRKDRSRLQTIADSFVVKTA